MDSRPWWQGHVLYNAFPRSFQDSDGDGFGDLQGIIQRLDYLEWLGIAGLWLNPIMPSPNQDWGYDVSDYFSVHPDFGGLDDLDALVEEAGRREIQVVLDLVPSHTSDQHPWFEEARRSRASRYRDYYVWRRGRVPDSPPTNWLTYFGESAWALDDTTGEYYLHNFSAHQPQLNWWNPEVRSEFDRVLRFWFDRGVGGMRIDALQALLYDPQLRDNPPVMDDNMLSRRGFGQHLAFNTNRPEIHEVIRRWRRLADDYGDPRLLFGETWVPTIEELAAYYGNGRDELHLAWNLPFLTTAFRAPALTKIIDQTLKLLPPGAAPAWAMSTHDGDGRAATRWCDGNDAAIRCALMLLLGLKGTSILYYGDEIGMPEPRGEVLARNRRDLLGDRDRSRTPMHWNDRPGGGFTSAERPWLPLGDTRSINVAQQEGDPTSVLEMCRDLVRLHRTLPDEMTPVLGTRGMLAWVRHDATVAIHLGRERGEVAASGTIVATTAPARKGERVRDTLVLEPLEGAVVRPT